MEIYQGYYKDPDLAAYLLDKEIGTVVANIGKDDRILHIAGQKRLSGTLVSQSVVVLTAKKVIIVNRLLRHIKSDIVFIPRREIASVRISHGLSSSSVFIRTRGSSEALGHVPKGEIKGLESEDANIVFSSLHADDEQEGAVAVRNYFAIRVENHYHMNGNTGISWSMYEESEEANDGEAQLVLAEASSPDTVLEPEEEGEIAVVADTKAAYQQEERMLIGGGIEVVRTINPDDLLIFKMRKEHPEQYLM
jgi:hypothetical protein